MKRGGASIVVLCTQYTVHSTPQSTEQELKRWGARVQGSEDDDDKGSYHPRPKK